MRPTVLSQSAEHFPSRWWIEVTKPGKTRGLVSVSIGSTGAPNSVARCWVPVVASRRGARLAEAFGDGPESITSCHHNTDIASHGFVYEGLTASCAMRTKIAARSFRSGDPWQDGSAPCIDTMNQKSERKIAPADLIDEGTPSLEPFRDT